MGRSNPRGPVSGGYVLLCVDVIGSSETPGAVTVTKRLSLPFACKVQEVSMSTTSSSGGASRPTLQIYDQSSNTLLSGSMSAVSTGTATATPTSSPSLVKAQRTRAKGDQLQIQISFAASEAVVGMTVMIALWVKGHVVAASYND